MLAVVLYYFLRLHLLVLQVAIHFADPQRVFVEDTNSHKATGFNSMDLLEAQIFRTKQLLAYQIWGMAWTDVVNISEVAAQDMVSMETNIKVHQVLYKKGVILLHRRWK